MTDHEVTRAMLIGGAIMVAAQIVLVTVAVVWHRRAARPRGQDDRR